MARVLTLVALVTLSWNAKGAQKPPRKLDKKLTVYLYDKIDDSEFITEEQERMRELTGEVARYFRHRDHRYWFELVEDPDLAEIQLRLVTLTQYGTTTVIRSELTIGDYKTAIYGRSTVDLRETAKDLLDNLRRFCEKNYHKLRSGS
ncbi:MAG: hypothetical protein ACE5JI_10190 [Acidobacteriota bacterium]